MKLIGYERLDYTSKNTGKQVKGYTLWYTYDKKFIHGCAAKSVYVKDYHTEGIDLEKALEKDIEFVSDGDGKLLRVRVIEDFGDNYDDGLIF